MRTLEDDNRRLKAVSGVDARRVTGERSAGEKLTWSAERYAAVEKLIADHGVSKRHACRLIRVIDLHGNIRRYAGGMTRFTWRMREIA